jgi:hypothetical protein
LSGVLEQEFSQNVWSEKIIRHFAETPRSPWLGLGWRQYLAWFCRTEAFLPECRDPLDTVIQWLSAADTNWQRIDTAKIFLQERRNNGEWLRAWLQAASDFAG